MWRKSVASAMVFSMTMRLEYFRQGFQRKPKAGWC